MTVRCDPNDCLHCLNGWWDFHRDTPNSAGGAPPARGWEPKAYLVPSFWTIPGQGVRRTGETYFQPLGKLLPEGGDEVWEEIDRDNFEFLFDAFGYPPAWSASRAGWARRTFVLDKRPPPGRRLWLRFEALGPRGTVFVNGREAVRHRDHFLPLEVDITDLAQAGENLLTVRIDDFERDAKGRAKTPCGNMMTAHQSGIWQDVWLHERSDLRLSDLTIATSVRQQRLQAQAEVINQGNAPRTIRIQMEVVECQPGRPPGDNNPIALSLGENSATIEPGANHALEWSNHWPNPQLWSPDAPHLYWLRSRIIEGGRILETRHERFGFREVWIEGPHLMLNGHPLHMFSDWGHKVTQFHHTEAWIRQWLGMIRGSNMNHSRLHTHPHPPLVLDLADELGILITGETGLHGSGGGCAGDAPEFWEASIEHIRHFVRRDKNHPCLVMWSVENEMRWNRDDTDLTRRRLPELRKLFNQLDPTRPAYHEGDSSLWSEREQAIVSRHYGKECSGIGWWDRQQPLHSGEMSLYHYQGPNNTCHLAGDAAYASYAACDRTAAEDTEWIVEAGRTLGVCNFGPWNLSCLENLRPAAALIELSYGSWDTAGVKPLRVPPHSSEFEFWQPEARGYTPNHSFEIQKRAFRPFAVIDLSRRSALFAGHILRRLLCLVNDLEHTVEGELQVELKRDREIVSSQVWPVEIGRGRVEKRIFEQALPETMAAGEYFLEAQFSGGGRTLDHWRRPLRIAAPPQQASVPCREKIAVFGSGSLKGWLDTAKVPHAYIQDLNQQELGSFSTLLIEQNTIEPESPAKGGIRRFLERGGRVVLLEQRVSLFEDAPIMEKSVQTAFRRTAENPVLHNLSDCDLRFWGDDPYPLLSGDSYVAHRLYRKNNCRALHFLADSGEGGFGGGDLDQAPLLEMPWGQGILWACQFRVTDKALTEPAADLLLRNLLRSAETYRGKPRQTANPDLLHTPETPPTRIAEMARAAEQGATVLVEEASEEGFREWSQQLGVPLVPTFSDQVFQAVREHGDPLLDSISNYDTCGIETWTYNPASRNFQCGSLFIEPAPELEPLLTTPNESCLYELFEKGGRSEPLRAHTLSRFLGPEKPPRLVVLGRVRHGAGQVIFNQFAPAADSPPRLQRLRHRLRVACLVETPENPLRGDRVPAAIGTGDGRPAVFYTLNRLLDDKLIEQLQECLKPTVERMAPAAVFNLLDGWKKQEDAEGGLPAAGFDLSKPILIYCRIESPNPRKNLETNLGAPNPEALTFLDCAGDGTVEATVNQNPFPPVDLSETGAGTISDIPLEAGFNQILLVWRPNTAETILKMQWRDIMRRPETGFKFL